MEGGITGFEVVVAFLARLSLVLLFLPFSALDKVMNFSAATGQARQAVASPALARALILAGLFVEVVMSAGVLFGIADRFCAFVLAGYCGVTALLWKQFWRAPDFRLVGESRGREVFWDFLKNVAVAGGFLMIAFGPNAGGVARFLEAPFASTHPYATAKAPQPERQAENRLTDQSASAKPQPEKAGGEDAPEVPYWHLYTDADGVSRHRRCALTRFELKSMQPSAAPQWQGEKHHDGMTVMVTVQPVGWTGAWHENPAPQWIVPLSGRWFVEAMDGSRVEMGPGEISFGEDQDCVTKDGRRGHLSGTVGDEPAVLMVVQFETERDRKTPCRFG